MNTSCLCVGSLPLVLTNDVSPPGNHSVRIVASTGPEATVLFFIDSNAVSTDECMIGRAGASPPSRTNSMIFLYIYIY